MAHDVFISYASTDKPVADALCATLEGKAIRCWIAPRDAIAGIDYPEQLIDAIHSSRIFVLVFSSSSNKSPQVMREVERAVHQGIPIIPVRLEDVPMSKSMEFFISTPHWLDALTPPLEKHLAQVAESVRLLLERRPSRAVARAVSEEPKPASPEPPPAAPRVEQAASPSGPPRLSRRPLTYAAAAAALLLLFFVGRRLLSGGSLDPALEGIWATAFQKDGIAFTTTWDIGRGVRPVRTVSSDSGMLDASNGRWRTVSRTGQVVSGTYVANGNSVSVQGGPLGTVTWRRDGVDPYAWDGGSRMTGRWKATVKAGGVDWDLTWNLDRSGAYTMEARYDDLVLTEAHGGRFKTVSQKTGVVSEGTYAKSGGDTFSLTTPVGTSVWTRVRQ